jgi:hypothetical protein
MLARKLVKMIAAHAAQPARRDGARRLCDPIAGR